MSTTPRILCIPKRSDSLEPLEESRKSIYAERLIDIVLVTKVEVKKQPHLEFCECESLQQFSKTRGYYLYRFYVFYWPV